MSSQAFGSTLVTTGATSTLEEIVSLGGNPGSSKVLSVMEPLDYDTASLANGWSSMIPYWVFMIRHWANTDDMPTLISDSEGWVKHRANKAWPPTCQNPLTGWMQAC